MEKETLLLVQRELTSADTLSTLWFDFLVPQGVEELAAWLSYDPLWVESKERSENMIRGAILREGLDMTPDQWEDMMPLGNLITLSLDDPTGYRGNAHRRDVCQEHHLREGFASPGFYPGEIIPGKWRAGIHIHALVTEQCCFRLEIQGVYSHEA